MVTIAIDIGNSRTHIGLVDLHSYKCISSKAFSLSETENKLLLTINEMISCVNLPIGPQVAISSVVKRYYEIISNLLANTSYKPFFVNVNQLKSLKINYKTPDQLGSDRISNALAAVRYKKMPCILISVGTAIVIDVIYDNTFLGGFIFPGIRLQFKSLNSFTDALPLVNIDEQLKYPLLLPSSTEECIKVGVIEGTAYAINGIVEKLCKTLSSPPFIISTGGDWHFLKNFINFKYEEIPEITLVGTASFLEEIGEV